MSFVGVDCEDGCFSSCSCKYKDCMSGPRSRTRQQRDESSGSSKYYLANDGDTVCSCCREEIPRYSRSHQSYKSLKSAATKERLHGKLHQMLDKSRQTVKLSSNEVILKVSKQSDAKKRKSMKVEST